MPSSFESLNHYPCTTSFRRALLLVMMSWMILHGQIAFGAQTNLAVTVRHAPSVNSGRIEGSVQQLTGESVTLNGGAVITGDLLVPGTPTILLNGNPTYGGTVPGSGATQPSNYQVTLNGNILLNHVRTRTDPGTLNAVGAPPNPSGTRSVTITSTNQSAGDFTTLRNLTVNGNVGLYTVPPGTYGNFIANGGSGFILGVAGSSSALAYNLQNLTLNGNTEIRVAGPVVLTIANGFTANGMMGTSNNAANFKVRVFQGGVTLNGGSALYGLIEAPNGTVIVNGNTLLAGTVQCDRFTLNGSGLLRWGAGVTVTNQAPVVTAGPDQTINLPGSAQLSGTVSDDGLPTGGALTFSWSKVSGPGTVTFGNSTLLTTTASFSAPGSNYVLRLTANDTQLTNSDDLSVTVIQPNRLPAANGQSVVTDEDVAKSITLSATDADGDALTFRVTTLPAHGTLATNNLPQVTYTPASLFRGSDNFAFVANDGHGDSAPATVVITINPVDHAPVANGQSLGLDEDHSISITLTGSDLENDPLTFQISTQPTHGTLNTNGLPVVVYTPATNFFGADSFKFIANDGTTNSAPGTIGLDIGAVNDAPSFVKGTNQIVLEDAGAQTVAGWATSISAGPANEASQAVHFIVVNDAQGLFTVAPAISPSGALTYTPAPNANGIATMSVQLQDDGGTGHGGVDMSAIDTFTIAITAVNDAPVVEGPTTASVNEDSLLNFIGGSLIQVSDIDAGGQPLTVTLSAQHGIVMLGGTNGISFLSGASGTPSMVVSGSQVDLNAALNNLGYFPATNYNGADSLTVVVNDQGNTGGGGALSASKTISITILPVNDAPVANSQSITNLEDTAFSVTLTGTDVEGDSLTFSVTSGPTNGVLSGTSPNLVYTPNTNFNGADHFSFVANDGQANSAPAVIALTIVPVNDAPVANGQAVTTLEDTAISITLTGSDVEHDALTFTVVTAPAHGVLSGTAPNLTYRPNTNFNGSDAFTFIAYDGQTNSAPATVSLTVLPVNDAPVANSQSITNLEDTAFSVTLTGTDVEGDALTFTVTRAPTNGVLSGTAPNLTYTPNTNFNGADHFSFVANDGQTNSAPATVSVTVVPVNDAPVAISQSITNLEDTAFSVTLTGTDVVGDSLTFSVTSGPTNGVLSGTAPNLVYTPNTNFNGSDAFKFKANDGQTNSALATVSITVVAVNDAPVAISQSITNLEDTAFSITLTGSDVENDALTFTVVGSPAHGVLSGTAPNLTYRPNTNFNGSDAFTFIANDGQANSAPATVSLTVLPVNDAPVAISQSITNLEDTAVSVTLTGTDVEGDALTFTVTLSPTHGVLSGAAPNLIYTPNTNFNGADHFSFIANDGQTNSAPGVITLTILTVNDAPIANSQSITNLEDTAFSVTLTGTDVEGDSLTFSVTSGPTNGVLSGTAPNLTYTPNTNFNGADHFSFVANDGQTNSATAVITLTILPVNDAPVAIGQAVTTLEDTAISITLTGSDVENDALTFAVVTGPAHGVLSGTAPNLTYRPNTNFNGSDAFTFMANDGQTNSALGTVSITVVPVNDAPIAISQSITNLEDTAFSVTLTGTDVEGDSLTFSVTSGPTNGVLSGTAPNLVYTPNTNFNGADHFSFVVNDGQTNSAPGVIALTILPVNDAPVAVGQAVTTLEDTAISITLTGTDVEGDALAFTVVASPVHGVLNGTAPNLTYRPNTNFNGSDTFTFIANDGQTNSALATVNITVVPVNDAPIANSQSITNLEDTAFSVTLTGTDVESDALTFSVTSAPTNGVLSGTAPNLTYTPNTNFNGLDAFTFVANDGQTNSVPAVISITVIPVNDAPVANAGTNIVVADFTLQSFVNLAGSVSDVDSPPDALTITWSNVSGPGAVSFTNAHTAVTMAIFSGPGVYVLNLMVDDGFLTNSSQVSVLLNGPPSVNAGSDQVVRLPLGGGTVDATLSGTASDDGLPAPVNLTVAWSSVSGPSAIIFGSAAATNTSATFSAAGIYVARLTAQDGLASRSDDVQITVKPANHAPVVNAGADSTNNITRAINLNGSATDDGEPAGLLQTHWAKVSGPGAVTFGASTSVVTSVSFSASGIYVLQLSASDTDLTSADDVTLTINAAPMVNAGPDQFLSATNGVPSVTLQGTVLDDGIPAGAAISTVWTQVSGPGTVSFANSGVTNTVVTFSQSGAYVLRLTASDTLASSSDDVVISLNQGPTVNAGADQILTLESGSAVTTTLHGTVADDGAPFGAPLTIGWSKVSGPGQVLVATGTNPVTTARFSVIGSYVLRLSASDSQYFATDDVVVHVRPPGSNTAPVVTAGPAISIGLTNQTVLAGFATDDGLPNAELTVTWSKISGPGTVTFADSSVTNSGVTFSQSGSYVLRLTASDGELTAFNEVTVAVYLQNLPPVVNAGPDQNLLLPNMTLPVVHSVTLPSAPVGYRWQYDIAQPGLSDPTNPGGEGWVNRNGLAARGRELIESGTQRYAGGVFNNGTGLWDGCSWGFIDDPSVPGIDYASGGTVDVYGTNGFVVSGLVDINHDGHTFDTGIWNGSHWIAMAPFVSSFATSGEGDIRTSGQDIYFGGNWSAKTNLNNPNAPLTYGIIKWDGTNFVALGEGLKDVTQPNGDVQSASTVFSIVVNTNGDVYVSGVFNVATPNGVAHNVAKWNGTNWEALGSGISGCTGFDCETVGFAIEMGPEGSVYVAGVFTTAGGQPASNIARWDGTNWMSLGGGLNGQAQALVRHKDAIYVAGDFSNAGDIIANRVAKWTGSNWEALGSGPNNGVNGSVFALASGPTGVYLGGMFSTAGGQNANFIAKWGTSEPPTLACINPVVASVNATGGAAVTLSTLAGQPCMNPTQVTWSVDGNEPEQSTTNAAVSQTVSFFHTYAPGLHTVTITADDHIAPPVICTTTVTVAPALLVTLNGSIVDDGLPSGGVMTQAWTQVSGPAGVVFGTPASLVTSVTFSDAGTYLFRLTGSDGQLASSDDVQVVVTRNEPPEVDAGPDFTEGFLGVAMGLNGVVSDDGLPNGTLTVAWIKIAGPGEILFGNAHVTNTTALFSATGTYVIRLTASDGQISRSDEMLVTVKQANLAPVILGLSAPAIFAPLTPDAISASYEDDGLPSGILETVWSKVSGPGPAVFANADESATTVQFVVAGDYVLRFTVSDTELTTEAVVAVHVNSDAPSGSGLVYAGADRTARAGEPLSLQGVAVHPNPSRTFQRIDWEQESGPGSVTFSDMHRTNTTATFDVPGIYEILFGASDPGLELFMEDSLIVTVLAANGQNQSPVITILPVFTLLLPNSEVAVPFEIRDDGLPASGTLTYNWSVVSGPGPVTFSSSAVAGHPHGFSTTMSAATAGSYVLQLTASDSELTASQQVQLQVVDPTKGNVPPRANAGPDQTVAAGVNLGLTGSGTDDNQPGLGLSFTWSQVSGPVTASIDNPYTDVINASFGYPGVYVRRLSVSDQLLTDADDVVITVTPAANVAPQVDAGPSMSIMLPTNSVTLNGVASDDGNPAGGSLTAQWSLLFGPGPVTFADATSLQTTVTFEGVESISWYLAAMYRFALAVSDGELTTTREVTITVGNPDYSNRPPTVDAGPDATHTLPDLFPLTGTFSDSTPFGFPYQFWTVVSGPAPASIEFDPFEGARFIAPGTYVLRYTGLDGFNGGLIASDDVTVTVVNPANFAPRISAGPPRSIALQSPSVNMQGSASDDGKPDGSVLTTGWSQIDGPGTVIFADINNLGSSVTFPQAGVYNLRLTGTDGELTAQSDVAITVVDTSIGNTPPIVFAGGDQTVSLGDSANLLATVTDDGLPFGSVSYNWTLISGPAFVQFNPPWDISSTASFIAAGEYHLALTASDGVLTSSDEVVVSVLPGNARPIVFAGFDTRVEVSESLSLTAEIFDDGMPQGAPVTAQWTLESGPGTVNFSSPTNIQADGNNTYHSSILALFSAPGSYVLRITASDSALSASQDLNVTVTDVVQGNKAPVIHSLLVGTAATFLPTPIFAFVTDDGLPIGSTLTSVWSVVSGPGSARFSDSRRTNTTVTFYAPGAYVLRLVASDGQLTAGDDLAVSVAQATNTPPFVFAGDPMAVIRPDVAHLRGTVLDDGLPIGLTLTQTWAKLSGPGTATFTPNANSVNVDAAFSANGMYVLSLTAFDGELTSSNRITIEVTSGVNQAPVVNAGPDFTTTVGLASPLHTEAADDRLPGGVLEVFWSKVSGPGTAEFSTRNAEYRVTFDQPGHYVLRLTANDSQLSSSDDVAVTVYPAATAPVVIIHAPVDGQPVTAITNIMATVQSALLTSYQLQYRLKPGGNADETSEIDWITLATNNVPVTNAAVGQLDPTLLLNGIYELRLVVTDILGQTVISDLTTVIVDRNMKVGNFSVSFNDLTVPVAGIPIQIVRTYDSRDQRKGDFGAGWNLGLKNIRLQKNRNLGVNWDESSSGGDFPTYFLDPRNPRLVTITFPDGKAYKFTMSVTPDSQFGVPFAAVQITYTASSDMLGTLVSMAGDDAEVVGTVPGLVDYFDLATGDVYNPTLFKLTTAENDVYIIDETDGLKSMTDRNGNSLTITPEGIIHSSGKSVTFLRDTEGRITQITDPAGNSMRYLYTTNGDLAQYIDRVNNTNSYTYDATHLLLTIVDPRGIQPLRNEFDASGRLVRQIDSNNHTNSFLHDLSNHREFITDRLGFTTVQEYDDDGNIIRMTDPLGNVTAYTFDVNDNQLSKTDALSNTTRFQYDSKNNKVEEVDPLGFTNRWTYDEFRNVLTMTDGRSFTRTNEYDPDGNLSRLVDNLGNVTRFIYDIAGNVLTKTDPLGNLTEFAYENFNRQTNALVRDARFGILNSTSYKYDVNGNQTNRTTVRTTPSGPQMLITSYVYDEEDRLVATVRPDGSTTQTIYDGIDKPVIEIDPLGRQTTLHYDGQGNLIRRTYPDLTFEIFGYDSESRKISGVDRAGRTMIYTNDPLGRVLTTVFPDGSTTNAVYDPIGRLITAIDERGNATHFDYDPNCGCSGRKAKITDALNHETHFTYDGNANEEAMTDPLGHVTQYFYDAQNRRTQVLFADGTYTATIYDALGRQTTQVDQSGRATLFDYDALARLIAVTDALGHVTRYGYNEVRNLVSQTDANNHTTTFTYDPMGRRTSRTLPNSQIDRFSYNLAGNLTNRVDFNGRNSRFTYDVADRLLQKTPDSFFGQPPVGFTYTATGKRASMSDLSGISIYQYNARDWLTNKISPQGNLAYTRDAHGNLLSIHSSNANGASVVYQWNPLNRLAAVVDGSLGQTAYEYDAAGNLAAATYPNGLRTAHFHDRLNRLTNVLTMTALNSPLRGYGYGLAPTGHRTAVNELTGRSVAYQYDETYRLTRESIFGLPEHPSGTIDYAYDAVGNRLSRLSTLPGVPSNGATYDFDDRLNSDTYDSNGNTIVGTIAPAGPAVNDQFDFENRLVAQPTSQVQIVYDGDGNRVRETVAGVTTIYLVDDQNPSGYEQVLEEATVLAGTPAVTRTYLYGADLIAQDQLLNGVWVASFYGYDGHGTCRYLTDSAGAVQNVEDFDAFGVSLEAQGTVSNNYRYAGEQFDPALGLYSLRARYLNVNTGRFWNQDTFEGFLDAPSTLNKYAYGLSDAVNRVDPSGLMSVDEQAETSELDGEITKANQPNFKNAQRVACKLQNVAAVAQIGKKVAQLAKNVAAGKSAEADFVAFLVQNAIEVVGQQIMVQTPGIGGGRRVIDIVIKVADDLFGIEVKSGGATRNAMQKAKDKFINAFGGKAFGKKALKDNLCGETIAGTLEVNLQ